ncbi:Egg cell-secreted protein 1.1 [Vitis vinifera]|uniref:Egg cell-secreted protein 1.1 n=1 Tax=Vitis vinifera TaxID=29760 RepID=A0A438JWE0_VITVI|nr:Egg cell-secreted protein 1.1 [Vitis vinifera]
MHVTDVALTISPIYTNHSIHASALDRHGSDAEALSFHSFSAWSLGSMASARYLDKSFSLAARLHADDDSSSKCWESLLELQACTGEVVLFFLNGETHLGPAVAKPFRPLSTNAGLPCLLPLVSLRGGRHPPRLL